MKLSPSPDAPHGLSRRGFLQFAVGTGGGILLARTAGAAPVKTSSAGDEPPDGEPDHTIRIATGLVELAPEKIVSTTLYNDQFPGPLLRLKEGQRVVVDIHNDTDTPEQFHWHGQFLPPAVDGAAEEGTPFIPPHGSRRISFVPGPAGFRFYHSHIRSGGDLNVGQYTGQAGPVYIEPKHEPGDYDREVFLVLKEFAPVFSKGGDMAADFLAPDRRVGKLERAGKDPMKESLANGAAHGYEVGYQLFSINGKMLGHGEPIRVKFGERVLFHILNASATETRSLALPGHAFEVVALDGNPVPAPAIVPVLWLGTAERISVIVEMNRPGVWVLGDLTDEDRGNGMGIVIEYADKNGKPQWQKPDPFKWDYLRFAKPGVTAAEPDETLEMTFAKHNAADHGFNRWTINGTAFSMEKGRPLSSKPLFKISEGRRYRLRMRNASDDIHPMHLHRHSFELTKIVGRATAGILKDVVMLGGYQEMEVDFTADNPGLTLFHCHSQLHMDFGFMALFQYV